MNLEDLRAAQVDERGSDSLQPLPPTFYEQAADYLADLRERRDRLADRADDPFESAEVRQLTNELETAETVVEALYERRVGKVVKQASLAAAGRPADDEGLTDEERALFGDLVERIEANRATVLDALDGEASSPAGSGTDAAERGAEPAPEPPADTHEAAAGEADGAEAGAPEAAVEDPVVADQSDADAAVEDGPAEDIDGLAEETAAAPADPDADQRPEPDGGAMTSAAPDRSADGPAADDLVSDRLTVRITASVGEIYGVDDHVYTLDAEDVVTLPSANARPLLERGAAERVE